VEILNQLGDLFLAAVPTVILVSFSTCFCAGVSLGPWSAFSPNATSVPQRATGSRSEPGRRARKAARVQRSAAESAGRNFVEQEAARRKVLEERQAAVSAARFAAQQELQAAKKALAADVEAARASLEQSSVVLAGEIAENILAGGPSGPGGTRRVEVR